MHASACQLRIELIDHLSHLRHVCLTIVLTLQDGEGSPVDVQVKDNGNGTYTCTYTPRKPVKHTVMVSWGGVNIPESPFRVSTCIMVHTDRIKHINAC